MTGQPDSTPRALKVAAGVAVGLLGLVLVAGGIWLATRSGSGGDGQRTVEPARPTGPATSSAEPSQGSSSGAGVASPTAPATGSAGPGPARAVARIAFRLGGTVYVAAETGTGSMPVARDADGPFALSPDGATLAVVDHSQLTLIDVATKRAVRVGAAELSRPVWAPDSSTVYFVALEGPTDPGVMRIARVRRDGSGRKTLVDGIAVSVSPRGRIVVVRRDDSLGSGGSVFVSHDGGPFGLVRVSGVVTAVGATDDRLIIGVADTRGGSSLVSLAPGGGDEKTLLGAPTGTAEALWGGIDVSPKGTLVAVTAVGDDGYSRISILPTAGGAETRLNTRRDGYFDAWSRDGSVLFFVEGNSWQGESTALVRVRPDGSSKRPIVTGAEL